MCDRSPRTGFGHTGIFDTVETSLVTQMLVPSNATQTGSTPTVTVPVTVSVTGSTRRPPHRPVDLGCSALDQLPTQMYAAVIKPGELTKGIFRITKLEPDSYSMLKLPKA